MKINYIKIILFFIGILYSANRPLAMKSFDAEDVNNVYNRGTYLIILPHGFNETFLTNELIWNPSSIITKSGFVNTFKGMLKNTNYEAIKTTDYKDEGTINEISGVISHKTSFPLKQ